MKMGMSLLGIVIIVIGLCGSAALALDYMGAPKASLEKGKLGAGYNYSYSNMNIDIKGAYFGDHDVSVIEMPEKLKINKQYVVLDYGLLQGCDVYLLLGCARNKAEIKNNTTDTKEADSGNEFAIGFGVKKNFYEDEKLTLGGMYQMSWVRDIPIDGRLYIDQMEPWYHTVNGELDLTEIQIAAGPTYRLNEFVSIYGGPFFHFISGDFNYRETCSICGVISDKTSNVRESSWFGGYVGTQVDIIKNVPFSIEYMHTAFADALGMSLIWRF